MNNPPDIIQNHYAFPNGQGDEGMTLRDYFAAAIMQGLLATSANVIGEDNQYIARAETSYKQADAMLKAREQ